MCWNCAGQRVGQAILPRNAEVTTFGSASPALQAGAGALRRSVTPIPERRRTMSTFIASSAGMIGSWRFRARAAFGARAVGEGAWQTPRRIWWTAVAEGCRPNRLIFDFDDGLDLDRNVVREGTHPDGGSRVAAGFAKDFDKKIGTSIDDVWVVGKVRRGIDHA